MTTILNADDPLAVTLTEAIRRGDPVRLRGVLAEHPDLPMTGVEDPRGNVRSPLHLATDAPGHYPDGPAMIRALIEAGADVNARFIGSHAETPLHWAASNDDVAALDALLDAGADIEARGGVIGGDTSSATPLADAVAFGQWRAARRLIERGARPNLWQAAALGLVDQVRAALGATDRPDDLTNAFWCACHGGQRATAEMLLDRGADLNWVGYDGLTPLDAARRGNADELVRWLSGRGARSATIHPDRS